jgi:hypothetical protein
VHYGGLVGLSDVNPKNRVHHGYVKNCAVDASISFFEQVEDRRAYCKEYVGEKQNDALIVAKNITVRFQKKESKDYSTILLPDMDENPVYNAEVTEPTCTAFGYTTYINEKTGYRYTDDYTAPAHTPGDWEVVTPPTYESEGCGGRLLRLRRGMAEGDHAMRLRPPLHAQRANAALQLVRRPAICNRAAGERDGAGLLVEIGRRGGNVIQRRGHCGWQGRRDLLQKRRGLSSDAARCGLL